MCITTVNIIFYVFKPQAIEVLLKIENRKEKINGTYPLQVYDLKKKLLNDCICGSHNNNIKLTYMFVVQAV